jgi:hypothetical protein
MLYVTLRQLPWCLLVRHAVSTMPVPLLPLLPVEFCGTPSSSSGGSFNVETWPLLRPIAINGSEGCTAWAKSSPDSGSEQMFSNIALQ